MSREEKPRVRSKVRLFLALCIIFSFVSSNECNESQVNCMQHTIPSACHIVLFPPPLPYHRRQTQPLRLHLLCPHGCQDHLHLTTWHAHNLIVNFCPVSMILWSSKRHVPIQCSLFQGELHATMLLDFASKGACWGSDLDPFRPKTSPPVSWTRLVWLVSCMGNY